jgi:hypothetical protein
MKYLFPLLLLVTLFSFTSCQSSPDTADDTAEETFDPTIIQGTWEMTLNMPADSDVAIPMNYKQYKFYTKDRFFFIAFDQDTVGLFGGGTYTIDRDTFVENLEFMSSDMSDYPTSFSYSHTIDGDSFVQKGVMPSLSGENEDFQLEEHYKKVEGPISEDTDHPYVGLWKMVQDQSGEATELQSIPDSVMRMKIVTPGHFYIVNWNTNRLMPYSAVFGSQKMEDGKYVETVLANTMDNSMNGVIIPYTAEGGEGTFRMHGEIPMEEGPYKIDERYTRVE